MPSLLGLAISLRVRPSSLLLLLARAPPAPAERAGEGALAAAEVHRRNAAAEGREAPPEALAEALHAFHALAEPPQTRPPCAFLQRRIWFPVPLAVRRRRREEVQAFLEPILVEEP